MKKQSQFVHKIAPLHLALAAGVALACTHAARAQTWSGLGGVDNWTTATNWVGNVAPVNNGTANVIFTGATRPTPAVNVAQDVNSVTFNAAAAGFTIGGPLGLTIRGGGIINQSANVQVLALPVTLATSQTWSPVNGNILFANGSVLTINPGVTLTTDMSALRTVTLAGSSNGAGALAKSGAGTLAVTGNLGHGGGTTINAGTIQLVVAGNLPDTGTLTLNGSGVFDVNGGTDSIGGLASSSPTSIVSLPGASTLGVGISGASTTFAGLLAGTSSTATFLKLGTGTLTLSGSSTYQGIVQVSAGTLQLAASERLGNACDIIIAGGTLDLQTFTETIDQFSISSGTVAGGGTAGSGTLVANSVNFVGGLVTARIAGNTSITKSNNSNNLIFTGTGSSYTGATNIIGGTLVTNAPDVLPDTTTVNVTSPGVLSVTNFSDTVAGITGNGTINVYDAVLTVGAGNVSSIFSGVIADNSGGAGFGGLTKIGTGSLTLSGDNTYRGTTTVIDGVLTLDGVERLNDVGNLVVFGGQFVVRDETIRLCTLVGGEIRGYSTGNGILRATQFDLRSGFVDASLRNGYIVKSGTSSVYLAAANFPTFTRIDAGILQISDVAALGTPDTIVSLNGGTLQLLQPLIIPNPLAVIAPSTIECLGDCILTNFSAGVSLSPLTKTGPGTLSLPSVVTTTGSLNVNAGTVYLGPTIALPMNAVNVANAAALHLDGGLLRIGTSLLNSGRVEIEPGARITGGTITNNGLITGSGTIASVFSNAATGDLRLLQNDTVFLDSLSPMTNRGLIEVLGGSLEVEAPATNSASTGLIYARSAELRFNGGLTNQGSLACSFGTTDVFGDINNQTGAVITISGGSDATFIDDVINNGTLRTSANGSTVFLGAVSGSGSFPGTGTVYLEGDLRPGNSPGFMSFGGDVVFGSFSALVEELGGTSLNQYDRTSIGGTAFLDGTLDVRLYGGYTLSGIQSFTILTANHISGRFQNVILPATTPPLRVIYTDTTITLSNCAADFNNDATVDLFDYLDFVAAFAANQSIADFNDDTVIDFFDYLDFIQAFSAGC